MIVGGRHSDCCGKSFVGSLQPFSVNIGSIYYVLLITNDCWLPSFRLLWKELCREPAAIFGQHRIFKVTNGRGTILCQRQPDLQSQKGPRNDFIPTPTRSSKSQRAAERFYANANQIFKVTKGRGTILCQRQQISESRK
jgi:hypothetical protein